MPRSKFTLFLCAVASMAIGACTSHSAPEGAPSSQTSASSSANASTRSGASPSTPPVSTPPAAPERPMIPAPPDVAAPPADAQRTASGLASKVIQAGTGHEHPTAESSVRVNYTGWTTDGQMFDSSIPRGEPAAFPLSAVIPGWTEGLQLMVVGEKRRLWIPVDLAYRNQPGRPQGMLVFDVELLAIMNPPQVPSDVAHAPTGRACTPSGLCSRVLTRGTGTEHPGPTSRVTVHYSGWTTDGQLFDSSVVRGEPASFPLNRVIPGWSEGVRLMVVGEKRRLWIPESLAYAGRPGAPPGMLVFDVELLSIDAP